LNLYKLPVIIEDGAFIGSRCIVVEGVHVGKKLSGANVCLTASTKIIDVTGETPVEMICSCPFSSDSR
jgi:2,3,4,5-tetrahydropyridine-2-carboxylate N-succinyltransferase